MSKITPIYEHLVEQARATGRDQHRDLTGGARLAVRADDTQITLTIARKTKRGGDRELVVFKLDCGVPDTAQRWPAEGQTLIERDGVGSWCVAFRWPAPRDLRGRIAEQVAQLDDMGYGELANEVATKSALLADGSDGLAQTVAHVDGMIARLQTPLDDAAEFRVPRPALRDHEDAAEMLAEGGYEEPPAR